MAHGVGYFAGTAGFLAGLATERPALCLTFRRLVEPTRPKCSDGISLAPSVSRDDGKVAISGTENPQ
jgi:hypothetical protein